MNDMAVCNVLDNERAIAEYVIMTILALQGNLFQQDGDLRKGLWAGSCVQGPPLATEVIGKTLGILGFGHIGQEVARLAKAFDMEIRSLRSGNSRAELESVLEASDFLVLACPLTPETRGLIGPAEFARMRPTASLINVTRGEVVDEAALYEALPDPRLRSAALVLCFLYANFCVPR